jgi:hypothetical protein
VQKILVDGGELAGQLLVEQAQNIRITLHDHSYGPKAVISPQAGWAERAVRRVAAPGAGAGLNLVPFRAFGAGFIAPSARSFDAISGSATFT